MIILKTKVDISKIQDSCSILKNVLDVLYNLIEDGITTNDLNKITEELIDKENALPAFKGYRNFPYSICASVNDCVVHGFPNNNKLLNGDILSIDCGVLYKGWYSDSAFTKAVGIVSENTKMLIDVTKECLYKGIENAQPYGNIGDISNTIQTTALKHNFGIVEKFGGHGIGRELHEEPFISNVGLKGRGYVLKPGMVIAIEPMLTLGNASVMTSHEGWMVKTKDGSVSAHFEHTVAITKEGPRILT